MIVSRAPLRISFVGGGTDLPDFYRRSGGRVISATIDNFVYVIINPTPMKDEISARYSISETVKHPSELRHERIRAALLDLGIKKGLEIGSYASLPAKTGLGSSSSYSVALMKALNSYIGKNLNKRDIAEAACRLEIELVNEPIGKQDQYAAAFGGFNIFQFNPDDSVDIEPVLIDYRKQSYLEDRILLFFTGITRFASEVLTEQKSNIEEKAESLKEMADLVPQFQKFLMASDIEGMASILHQNWVKKKSLASGVSSSLIDGFYEVGLKSGALGGKILGAGGGGCLMFFVPITKRQEVLSILQKTARKNDLFEAREIPVKFIQSGVDILFNSE